MNKFIILLAVYPTIGVAWDTAEIVKLGRDLAKKRFIDCIGIVYPQHPEKIEPKAVVLARQFQSDFYIRLLPFSIPPGRPIWPECPRVMYILLSWLSMAQQQMEKFMAVARGPMLNFLAENITIEDFLADKLIPLESQPIFAVRSENGTIKINQAFRITSGNQLEIVFYANWDPDRGLDCASDYCDFYVFYDLKGIPIRATTKPDWPICDLTRRNGSLKITGYFGAIFYDLGLQVNFRPIIVPATENRTGSYENGTWNGLIGMLLRNETDLAVGPMALTEVAMQVTGNLQPLLRTHFQVFFKQHGTVVQWDAVLKPFSNLVWQAIALWLLLNSIILHFVYDLGWRFGSELRVYSGEYNTINAFFGTLRAFCQQGSSRLPTSWPTRSIVFTGYLTSSVLFTAYSASLISKLTLEEPSRPFDSLETFLENGKYTLLAIQKSTEYTYFKYANDELLKSIYQKMMYKARGELPGGKEEGLIDVCTKDKTAFFVTEAATRVAAREIEKRYQCQILTFSKPLAFADMTILTQKYTPMIGILNRQLQKMVERGLLKRLQGKEWPLVEHISTPSFEPVQLQQVIQITAILASGIILSLIILTFEILISKSKLVLNHDTINGIMFVIYVTAILAAMLTMLT